MIRSRPLVGLLLAAAIAALLLYPSLSPGRLLGHENLDNWSHAWGMRWFSMSLLRGELPWEITGAAFPMRRVLWYADPLGALLTLPLQFISAAWAYNGLQILQVTSAGLAGWLMGRAFGGRGLVAAAAMGTMPILQSEIWNGVVEACWVAPVGISGWLAARRSPWTGVAVGISAIATPYLGLGSALFAGTVLLAGGTRIGRAQAGRPLPRLSRRLRDVLLCAAVSLVLAIPQYMLMKASFQALQSFVHRPLFTSFDSPNLTVNAVDPRAYLHWGDFWSHHPADSPLSPPWRHTPYLGWCVTVLALLGARRERLAWVLAPAAVMLTLSLGFFVWWEGGWLPTPDGGRYALPLYWICDTLQISLSHHMRFAATVSVMLAALADRAAGRLAPALAALIVFENLAVGPICWPRATSPADPPAAHLALPADGKAIIDLPADAGPSNRTNRYLYWQAVHDHPVPWVNKVGSMGTASMNPALRRLVLLSALRPPAQGAGVPREDADLQAAARRLAEQGFGYVVLHPELMANARKDEAHRRLLSELFGVPEQIEDRVVWRIR